MGSKWNSLDRHGKTSPKMPPPTGKSAVQKRRSVWGSLRRWFSFIPPGWASPRLYYRGSLPHPPKVSIREIMFFPFTSLFPVESFLDFLGSILRNWINSSASEQDYPMDNSCHIGREWQKGVNNDHLWLSSRRHLNNWGGPTTSFLQSTSSLVHRHVLSLIKGPLPLFKNLPISRNPL